MKCLQLKSKSTIKLSDPVYLAKVPIIPNQYLFNKLNYNLGILKADDNSPLLLITDNEEFLQKYKGYYQERFAVEEKGDSYVVPANYEVVYGSVKFENETKASEDEELEAFNNEKAE